MKNSRQISKFDKEKGDFFETGRKIVIVKGKAYYALSRFGMYA